MTMKSAESMDTTVALTAAKARTSRPITGNRTTEILEVTDDWEVIELRRRVHAGVWAARTALVVSVPFAVTAWALGEPHAWFFYMVLPVIAAFFSGVFFGASICSRNIITDEALAGRQGALVALVMYLILAAEVAALSFTPIEAAMNAFMFSVLISGWIVFPISFLAGILAFRAREGAYRFEHEPA